MKKNALTIWVFIILITFKLQGQQFNTQLIGNIDNVKDSTIVRIRSESIDIEDYQNKAYVINGKYKFELNLKEPIMFFLSINDKNTHLLLDQGTIILKTKNLNELKTSKIIQGPHNTLEYDEFYKKKNHALNFNFIEENKNSFMALYLIWRHRYNYKFTKEKLKRYFLLVNKKWASTTYYKDLKYITTNYNDYSAGNPFYNFSLKNENDKNVTLTDFKGKYLLVYFTSRYCAPCVHSIPYHKVLYNKYHPEGFEILYVYLDKKKDIIYSKEKYKLNWNLTYLKNTNSKILKEIRIDGTPHAWLIDKQGVVITDYAANTPNLKNKLKKIFK